MACKNICKLCKNLIISTAVNYDSEANQIVIALPAGTYTAGEKYCIVIAQTIPTSAAISATVVASIGTAATRYQINQCDCEPLTACGIRTRTKYSTILTSSAAGASFRMLGKICGCPNTGAGTISG